MKKHFLLLVLGFFIGISAAHSQYYLHGIGLRTGTTFGVSYKRFLASWPFQQAIEGAIGFQVDEGFMLKLRPRPYIRQNGVVLEAYYVAHLDVGFDTRFSAYAGLGFYMGTFFETDRPVYFGGGGTGQIGIEYNFRNVPINMSLEWNPIFGYPRSSPARGTFAVRYLFRDGWN